MNKQKGLIFEFDAFTAQPLLTNMASITGMFIDSLGIFTGVAMEDENLETAVDLILNIESFKTTIVSAFTNPGADAKFILTQMGKAGWSCSQSFISALVQSGVIKESSKSIVKENLLAFATGGSSKVLDGILTANDHLPLLISMITTLPKDKVKNYYIVKDESGEGGEISNLPPRAKARFSYQIMDEEEPLEAPVEVRFDASDSCLYTEEVEYRWQFEEGEEVIVTEKPIINHIFGKGGRYTVSLQIKNKDGSEVCSEEISKAITIPGKIKGDIRATLRWSTHADIDLHAYNPEGEHIYYRNTRDSLGGYLDHDIIPDIGDGSSHVENITWSAAEAIDGNYKFAVKYYNDPGNDSEETEGQPPVSTGVRVTITRNEGTPKEKTDSFTYNLTREKQIWTVFKFSYPEGIETQSIQPIEIPNTKKDKN